MRLLQGHTISCDGASEHKEDTGQSTNLRGTAHQPTHTWEQAGKDALIPRFEAQGLAVNGKLYVFGGFFNSKIEATLQSDKHDPATNTWTPIAPLPEPVTHAGQATDGKFIYLAGGFVGDHPGPSSNKLWKYHIETDTWSEGPPLPEKRGGGALVLLNNSLHYFGGVIRTPDGKYMKDFGDHWVLQMDHPNAIWGTAALLPNPRNHMGGCAAGGKIYAVGGQHLGDERGGNQPSVHVYDPLKDAWTAIADLPVPKGHVAANVIERKGRIIVVSGVTQGQRKMATIDEYNPKTNTWVALTPLPEPRQSPVSGIIDGQLIVTGGSLSVTTWIGRLTP